MFFLCLEKEEISSLGAFTLLLAWTVLTIVFWVQSTKKILNVTNIETLLLIFFNEREAMAFKLQVFEA